MSSLDELKARLRAKLTPTPTKLAGLSTGATLVNLACTGRPNVGLLKGHYYYYVGDTTSGKTWLAHCALAEAAINKDFADYRLIFDNAEDGALFDIAHYFGKALAQRLESPGKGEHKYSRTIEEFYFHVDDAVRAGRPFVYVLDSLDSLSSESEQKKFRQRKKAARTDDGKPVAGSYGDGKAKANSAGLRVVVHELSKSGSILIVIGQSRDNIGFDAMFNPKTHSGGNAISFYATHKLWFSIKQKIKKKVRGKPLEVGILSKVQIKKTRATGRPRTVLVPILHGHGVDDVGAMIQYLLDFKHWNKKGSQIEAPEFGFTGTEERLVAHIETENKERELRKLVTRVWQEIEEASTITRKKRYV